MTTHEYVRRVRRICVAFVPLAWIYAGASGAQEAPAVVEEVVVTASKKAHAESVQDVPFAVTAFGASQLETLNYKNISSLSYEMPNVSLESNSGTTAATANFSIRGLGINSTIPSIDPTVGVFVDGVYMGIVTGTLFDDFDLERIEVLRGPQGVLFGRNVTGGAVLLRTKAPSDTLEMAAHAAVETGPNYIGDASISGPLIPGTLSFKLAARHNEDEGWFENDFNGRRFGDSSQTVVRPALRWTPNDALDVILRTEHGEASGDGSANQNHALFPRDSFHFSNDAPGHNDTEWNQAFLESTLAVAPGDGVITNIVGWREFETSATVDVDSSPAAAFHGELAVDQSQFSEELRYSGRLGPAQVTTGIYYFEQDLLYLERRLLAQGLVDRAGGGDGDFSTAAVFAATDWSLSRAVTLNLGLRYTSERKRASISTLRAGGGSVAGGTLVPDFNGRDRWNDLSPRIGFQWTPAERTQLYASWSTGFRSGGFNFRNTDPGVAPGPFDSEKQRSVELGWKQDFAQRRARINVAVFRSEIDRLQREVNSPGALGITQVISNVGDATIQGAELEASLRATSDLTVAIQAGYLHGSYDSLHFDLNGDGRVNSVDESLELPRLAPWSYGASIAYDRLLGSFGELASRVSFNHRDASFFTDNNLGRLNDANMLNANVTLTPAGGATSFSVYATNLLDEVTFGGESILPNSPAFGAVPGGPLPTFSPLNKGRVVGAELRVKF